MRRTWISLAVLGLLLPGCNGSTSATVPAAIIFTSIAAATSVANRAAGGCYASCPSGTTCNEKTGLCDALPCHARCRADERCDVETDRCVPTPSRTLAAETQQRALRRPVLPDAIEYRGCQAIDPETGLPAVPLLPTEQCTGQ